MLENSSKPEIVILEDLCKGCGICIEFCPAKTLRVSSRMTKKGVNPPQVVNAAGCTACRICQHYCPDFAIFVVCGV